MQIVDVLLKQFGSFVDSTKKKFSCKFEVGIEIGVMTVYIVSIPTYTYF